MRETIVRDACPGDGAAIAQLVRRLGHSCDAPVVEGWLRGLFDGGNGRLIVAERDGRVVGVIHVHRPTSLWGERAAEIAAVFTEGRGEEEALRELLVAQAHRWAAGRGCDRVLPYAEREKRFSSPRGTVRPPS